MNRIPGHAVSPDLTLTEPGKAYDLDRGSAPKVDAANMLPSVSVFRVEEL